MLGLLLKETELLMSWAFAFHWRSGHFVWEYAFGVSELDTNTTFEGHHVMTMPLRALLAKS